MAHYPTATGGGQVGLLRAQLTSMDASEYHAAIYDWPIDHLLTYLEMSWIRSLNDEMDEAMRKEIDKHKRSI